MFKPLEVQFFHNMIQNLIETLEGIMLQWNTASLKEEFIKIGCFSTRSIIRSEMLTHYNMCSSQYCYIGYNIGYIY